MTWLFVQSHNTTSLLYTAALLRWLATVLDLNGNQTTVKRESNGSGKLAVTEFNAQQTLQCCFPAQCEV